MKKVMLINVLQPEETRIAILEDGVLQELYVERNSNESFVGNIYKGKIVNIEPSIQAAFVDFGVGRNGFLHISDVDPAYFESGNGIDRLLAPADEGDGERRREKPQRQELVERTDTRDDWTFDDDDDWSPPPRGERSGRLDREPSERPDRPERGERSDRTSGAERERADRPDRADRSRRRDRPDRKHSDSPRALKPREEQAFESAQGSNDEAPLEPREPRVAPERSPRGDRNDRNERGGRRGRGRGRDRENRGDRRDRPLLVNDLPEEVAGGSDKLPSIDDLRLEDLPTPAAPFEVEPTRRRPEPAERPAAPRHERPAEPEPDFGGGILDGDDAPPPPPTPKQRRPEIRRQTPIKESAPQPLPPAAEVEDDFGAGLLDDSNGAERRDDREPPFETQPSVYRRTEGDDFGGDLLDDEPGNGANQDSANDSPNNTASGNADSEAAAAESEKRQRHRRGGRGRKRGKRGQDAPPTGSIESTAIENADHFPHDGGNIDATHFDEPQPRQQRFEEPEIDEIGWSANDDEDDPFVPRDLPETVEPVARDREERPSRDEHGSSRRQGNGGRGRDRRDGGRPQREPADLERNEGRGGDRGPRRESRGDRDRDGRGRDGRRPRGDRSESRDRGPRQSGNLARRPRQRPPIQDIFRRGNEVMVQVIKEGIGNKGPTLSTYISIPGRYLVLMPGLSRVGVSRKIVDDDKRRQLRSMMLELERPRGVGFIVRTAGLERNKEELGRDMSYLARLWEVVVRRIRGLRGPGTIYQESDMIIRTIRDIVTGEIDTIYIDEPVAFERAKEFLEAVMPKYVNRLKLYDDSEPLFHNFRIEEEIANIQKRSVPLPNGGSIVIDQTEALVAIDVNSGNFRKDDNAEETAYQINLSAAKEIARQLRLRDLGGVIVNDFIDMREERHRRAVEQALRDAVERDRARTKVLRMSAFGMIEMTRQRIRPSLKRSLYRECMSCQGTGQIKTIESVAIECMRMLAYASQHEDVARINLTVDSEISAFLQNHKRREIAAIEEREQVTINILGKESRFPEALELNCFDANGDAVELNRLGPPHVGRK